MILLVGAKGRSMIHGSIISYPSLSAALPQWPVGSALHRPQQLGTVNHALCTFAARGIPRFDSGDQRPSPSLSLIRLGVCRICILRQSVKAKQFLLHNLSFNLFAKHGQLGWPRIP